MGTHYATLYADLFLNSYKTDFIQSILSRKERKLAQSLDFIFHYIDNVFSLKKSKFCNNVDRIYGIELEIKKTTEIDRFVLCFYLHIDSKSELRTKLYDKGMDLIFASLNFL